MPLEKDELIITSIIVTLFLCIFCTCRSISRPILRVQTPPPAPNDHVFIEIPFENLKKHNVYEQSMCPICLERFDEKSPIAQLQCNHVFHRECIIIWLNHKFTCPMCNISLPEEPEMNYFLEDNV